MADKPRSSDLQSVEGHFGGVPFEGTWDDETGDLTIPLPVMLEAAERQLATERSIHLMTAPLRLFGMTDEGYDRRIQGIEAHIADLKAQIAAEAAQNDGKDDKQ